MGLIPLSAEIDKRALTLYGTICRMKEFETLKQTARRQLAVKSLDSKSWFIQIYKLGLQYGIDVIAALNLNWSKAEWKIYTKHAVWSYHKYDIKSKATTMTSLKYMYIAYASMKSCHLIWPSRINNKMDPYQVHAANIRIKLLTSTYMLQSTIAKYYPTTNKPTCQLCNVENETLEHFLIKCTALKKIRSKSIRYLKKQLKRNSIKFPSGDENIIKLILNGHDSNAWINKTCSVYCYALHNKRYQILKDKGLLYRSKKTNKRKKVNEIDAQNCCIYCNKEVGNDDKAIECEKCSKWQHIKCDGIMDGWKYNRVIKGKEKFQWMCVSCNRE
jgi:hypothetical protein